MLIKVPTMGSRHNSLGCRSGREAPYRKRHVGCYDQTTHKFIEERRKRHVIRGCSRKA